MFILPIVQYESCLLMFIMMTPIHTDTVCVKLHYMTLPTYFTLMSIYLGQHGDASKVILFANIFRI